MGEKSWSDGEEVIQNFRKAMGTLMGRAMAAKGRGDPPPKK